MSVPGDDEVLEELDEELGIVLGKTWQKRVAMTLAS